MPPPGWVFLGFSLTSPPLFDGSGIYVSACKKCHFFAHAMSRDLGQKRPFFCRQPVFTFPGFSCIFAGLEGKTPPSVPLFWTKKGAKKGMSAGNQGFEIWTPLPPTGALSSVIGCLFGVPKPPPFGGGRRAKIPQKRRGRPLL